MSSHLRRFAVLELALIFCLATGAPAADDAPRGGVYVSTEPADASLKKRPVMDSVLGPAGIVRQEETHLGNSVTITLLPPGTYDVRIEGVGVVTLLKRGIQVSAHNNTAVVGGPIEAGKGVHVVEYSTAAMTREELAATLLTITEKLAKIEADLAKLQK
jgi:hypothetical protein